MTGLVVQASPRPTMPNRVRVWHEGQLVAQFLDQSRLEVFAQGWAARMDLRARRSCPHADRLRRNAWLLGWWRANTAEGRRERQERAA